VSKIPWGWIAAGSVCRSEAARPLTLETDDDDP
jgi:hypothetical protein